jgi:hypothetical protein
VAMRCQFSQVCQIDFGGVKAKPFVSFGEVLGVVEEEGSEAVGEASAMLWGLAHRLGL